MDHSDKLLIAEAISAYFFALDDFTDLAAIARCFDDDAVWVCYDAGAELPSIQFSSPAAFAAAMTPQAVAIAAARLRHHLTGLTFTQLSDSRARTQAKVLVTAQPSVDTPPVLRNTARITAEWNKSSDGWKIARWEIRRESKERT